MSHQCHATGCQAKVPQTMWGCRFHWYMLPKRMRDAIWAHYRAGQERDQRPSKAYLEAARAALVYVAETEGKVPDTVLYDSFLSRS